jgi:uncharacterized membrane protein
MQSPGNNPHNFSNHFGQMPVYPPAQTYHQKPRLPWKPRIIALLISIGLYALACALPVLDFSKSDWSHNSEGPMIGYVALIVGWMGIVLGQFAWLANFIWLLSLLLVLFRCWIATVITAILTTLLALQTYTLFSHKVPANEAATEYLYLQEIKIGFYVWIASFLAVGISAIILRQRERALAQTVQAPQYPQMPYQ